MTETARPAAPPGPSGPPPIALTVAMALVTTHRLRLVDRHDSRLGELAGTHELAAAAWTGPRAALVAFYRPPADVDEAARDVTARVEAARHWGERRLAEQRADRCDILLVALGPVSSPPAPEAAANASRVRVGAVVIDADRDTVAELLPVPAGLPDAGELRAHLRSLRAGAEPPTLAAVDLAERQTVAGGYARPTTQALVTAPRVTYALIGSFVAIFLLEKVLIRYGSAPGTSGVTLLDFGAIANVPPYRDDWWRYVSSAFLHDDVQILHILGNSVAMLFIGRLVEQLYGRLVLIATFLITAAAGGLLWVGVSAVGLNPAGGESIGASGGIAGLMGLLILLGRVQGRNVPPGVAASIRNYVGTYIVLTLIFGFLLARVNNYAHIGGFAAGVLLSLALPPMASVGGRNLRGWERAALAAVAGAGAMALGIAAHHLTGAALHPGTG